MPTAYYNDNGVAKPIMGVTGGGSGGGVKYSDDDDTNVDRNLYVIGPGGSLPGVLQQGDVVIDVRGSWVADWLPLTGGEMSGPITLPGDPTEALHAATKQYVDAGVKMVTGSYTGNGINGRLVPLSITPHFVAVNPTSGNAFYVGINEYAGFQISGTSAQANTTTRPAPTVGGFEVRANSNTNGATYNYVAIGFNI